jgi:hypothetical protein
MKMNATKQVLVSAITDDSSGDEIRQTHDRSSDAAN